MGSSERVLRRLACPISSAGGQWWRTLHGWSGSGCNAGAQEAATSSHADGTSTSSTDGGSAHQLLACSQQPPCDERGWAWQQRLANLTWQPREDHPGAPGAAATGQKPHASSALPLRSLSHAWRRHRARLPTWPPDAQHPSSAALLRHASTSAANAPSPPHQPPLPAWLAALPAAWVPYAQLMRLDRPIGTWLLLWPCLWSTSMAAQPGALPDLWTISLFSLGAVLLRGAGCTVNDLWDRELDARVERTRSRPLASGALQPWQALALLGGQLSLGLCILLQLNLYSQVLGASSLLLVGTYPLMKRVTYWPQAYLGLTINWGALMGWAAVRGSCDWAVVLPLYGAGVCWSLVYDTIYAHQDKRDDVTAGVRSTALLFGRRTKPILSGFAALQLALLTASGAAAGMGPGYYVGVAAMGAHLARQIYAVDLDNGPHCSATFVSNKWAGALLFAGCVAGRTFA